MRSIRFKNLRFERAKNISKTWWKLVRFDSTPTTIGWSQIFQMSDSFEICSIRKFMIQLIRKLKNNLKNSIKINSKFVRFDSTSKGCTNLECGKQTMSSANYQAEYFLSSFNFCQLNFLLSLQNYPNSKFVYLFLDLCGL